MSRFVLVGGLKALSTSGVLVFSYVAVTSVEAAVASRAVIALTVIFAVLTFAKLGLDGVVLRSVAAFGDGRIGPREARVIRGFAAFSAATCAISIAIIVVVGAGSSWQVYVLWASIMLTMSLISSAALRGLKMQASAMLIEPGMMILISSAVFAAIGGGPQTFFAALCILASLSVGFTYFFLRGRFDPTSVDASLPWKEMGGFVGFDVGNYVLTWSSNLIVFWFVAEDAVAEYSLHFRLAMAVNFALVVYNVVRSPTVAECESNSDVRSIFPKIRRESNLVFAASVLFVGAVFLCLPLLDSAAGAFGAHSIDVAEPLLMLLCIAFLINVLFGPVGMILNMRGNSVQVTAVFLASSAVFLVVSSQLAGFLGLLGVAIAYAMVQVLQNLLMNAIVAREIGEPLRRVSTWN